MAQTVSIRKKLDEFIRHSTFALDFFFKEDYEHSLGDFRKAAEAFMKIFIIKHFGDPNGEKIVLGEINVDLVDYSPFIWIDYQNLLDIIYNKNLIPLNDRARLKDLQSKTNPAAHNPNVQTDFKPDAELCKSQSYELTKLLFDKLREPFPEILNKAYQGDINPATLISMLSPQWEEITNYTDNFSRQNKYILVSPNSYKGISNHQLEILSRIHWSFILDFDKDTKENGLFKSFQNVLGIDNIVPLNIKQEGQKGIVNLGNFPTTNWLFANGLQSMPTTIANTVRNWKSLRYNRFIKSLLQEYFSKETCRYIIVYLCNDIGFEEEIVRIFTEIDALPKDLVKHVFISNNENSLSKIEAFEAEFDIDYKTFNLNIQNFISEISNIFSKQSIEIEKILVPARTVALENDVIDISDIYFKLNEEKIQVIYQNIDRETVNPPNNEIPAFYQGELITWHELSTEVNARRYKTSEIITQIRSHLTTIKKSFKFNLYHKPGAGGTTLARSIAFQLRKDFPTAILMGFDKAKTYNNLRVFLERVNRPAMVIVESVDISVNDLEDLITSCNTNKIVIGFVYVRRSIKIEKNGEFSAYLTDVMADVEEFDRFVGKVQIYAKEKTHLFELERGNSSEYEVIDFSLAINEKEYSKNKLTEYISAYIEKLEDQFTKFTVYSSIIYYYSQRTVSELVFRSLFKKSLSSELKQIAVSNQHIRKIILQEYDRQNYEYTEYWRPRFSKFAEIVLMNVLGRDKPNNWKDLIDVYSLEFIRDFKNDNEYLTEDTLAILKGIFFERNNEDLLGIEEQWRSAVDNDKFSYLISDIGDKQKQKAVLTAIVQAYPTESHFLGHIARFIYEKAENEIEFQEAEKYVAEAIENDGKNDFNLQHIGGMCKRRQIEFIKRNYRQLENLDNLEFKIQDLADKANEYFNASRKINPFNIHAYVAQVQTLIFAIDFGKEISGTEQIVNFINSDSNTWYLEQYNTVLQLIHQAQMLIEQKESLALTTKIQRSKKYISKAEGNAFEILGDYRASAAIFKSKSEIADRQYRPAFRIMYVQSTLLGKVGGNRSRLDYAWPKLKSDEILDIQKAIDNNFLQDPSNISNFRLWFKMVRYSGLNYSIEEIISRVKLFYEQTEDLKIAQLEASFYLFVLNTLITLQSGESINPNFKKEAEEYLIKCKELSKNPKFNYEYYAIGDGIESLVNYRYRSSNDEWSFQRVQGAISRISSRQQGWIILASGLEVFFVPHIGSFIQGKDESTKVDFQLAFRHEGLLALDVKRLNENSYDNFKDEKGPLAEETIEQEEFEPEIIEEIEISDELDEELQAEVMPQIEMPKLPGLKEVGKIDLTNIYDPRKKRN